MKVSIEFPGSNQTIVDIGDLRLYFSYKTVVAFSDSTSGLKCSENVWSTTTGKFLNYIEPDKKSRLQHDEFSEALQGALERHNLS
jgi:hypothetical protein